MKKKLLIPVLCVLLLIAALLAKKFLIGAKPLRGLTAEEVTAASAALESKLPTTNASTAL